MNSNKRKLTAKITIIQDKVFEQLFWADILRPIFATIWNELNVESENGWAFYSPSLLRLFPTQNVVIEIRRNVISATRALMMEKKELIHVRTAHIHFIEAYRLSNTVRE